MIELYDGIHVKFCKTARGYILFDDSWYQREDVAGLCLHYIRRRTLQQVSIEPTCQNTQHPSPHSKDISIDAIISRNSLQANNMIYFFISKRWPLQFVIPERGCSRPAFTLHKEKDTPASEYRAHLSKHTASKPTFQGYFYRCNHIEKFSPSQQYDIFFHFQKVTSPVFLFRWEHRLKIIEILGCDKQENLCF